jgi:hypothetical protein
MRDISASRIDPRYPMPQYEFIAKDHFERPMRAIVRGLFWIDRGRAPSSAIKIERRRVALCESLELLMHYTNVYGNDACREIVACLVRFYK